ncbi:unnamed protein product [Rotaria sordida]|uniref:Uncharacterized protein n=1 Tax=Rotaria sordida TaxID=392033 RepID=A0A814PCS5_9BILA|nr:unnamed protein product [Rotaria sordida]CAF3965634.1 unnamed protein product [Rotaria sordida]
MVTMFFGPLKAGFELLCGDEEGASRTMNEFTQTNPIVMPCRLLGAAICNDPNDCEETLKAFGKSMGNMACSTPLVGHAISAGYAIAGKEEQAEKIFLQASRTTVVAGAGIVGSIAGPAGAAAAAIEAGTIWDMTESHATGKAKGIMTVVEAIRDDKELRPGEVFDSLMTPVGDAITGVAAAKTYDKIMDARKKNQMRQQVQSENNVKTEQLNNLEKKITDQGVDNSKKLANDMSKKADILREQVAENESKLLEIQRRQRCRIRNPNEHVNGHVSVTIIDEYENESTGYSKRLTDASETTRFDRGPTSRLEQAQPSVTRIQGKPPLNICGEHMAYQGLSSDPVITYALQIKDGVVQCVDRCANCAQYDLGNVITDSINGTPVPFSLSELPSPGSYIGAVVTGTMTVAVSQRRNGPGRS